MYVPAHFRIPDDAAWELLATPRPGNLVTMPADAGDAPPSATFVPFHLEGRTLVTHLVRNNPQAVETMMGRGLAIIDVMDGYVSPLWYATNDVMPNVPTWDYVTLHVTGPVRVDTSPEAALAAARELTDRFESEDVLTPVGDEKLERMARAIVRVDLQIEQIEGKAKMSQNRHPDDVRGLADRFAEEGATDMAEYLRRVSLPHAEERFGTIQALKSKR